MYSGEGKVTCPPSVGENLYLSLRKALHRQHIYCLASMKLKNCAIMNLWERDFNILDYNISKIADYAHFKLNCST